MGETEGCHVLGGDLSGLERSRLEENFRMSRVTFEYLAIELYPIISKRDTNFRKAISARQRLVVALYRLADTASYRTIANFFAIGKSTVCEIVVQVCNAIYNSFFQGTYDFHNRHKKFGKGLMGRVTVPVFLRL